MGAILRKSALLRPDTGETASANQKAGFSRQYGAGRSKWDVGAEMFPSNSCCVKVVEKDKSIKIV